jgi:hypothetical protein
MQRCTGEQQWVKGLAASSATSLNLSSLSSGDGVVAIAVGAIGTKFEGEQVIDRALFDPRSQAGMEVLHLDAQGKVLDRFAAPELKQPASTDPSVRFVTGELERTLFLVDREVSQTRVRALRDNGHELASKLFSNLARLASGRSSLWLEMSAAGFGEPAEGCKGDGDKALLQLGARLKQISVTCVNGVTIDSLIALGDGAAAIVRTFAPNIVSSSETSADFGDGRAIPVTGNARYVVRWDDAGHVVWSRILEQGDRALAPSTMLRGGIEGTLWHVRSGSGDMPAHWERFDQKGEIAEEGDLTLGPAQLRVDGAGYALVLGSTDTGEMRVQKLSPSGALIWEQPLEGRASQMEVDASGRIYVCEPEGGTLWQLAP